MNQDMSILNLVLHASTVVQIVMLLLLLVSVASWSVIFSKVTGLKRVRQDNNEFDREFWAGRTLQELYQDASSGKGPSSPQERIFAAGMREFMKMRERRVAEVGTLLDGARRAMRASYQREMDAIESHLDFLGSVGSVSPYVGLFGTVWGSCMPSRVWPMFNRCRWPRWRRASPKHWWPRPLVCLRPSPQCWRTTALPETSTGSPSRWSPSSKRFPTSWPAMPRR